MFKVEKVQLHCAYTLRNLCGRVELPRSTPLRNSVVRLRHFTELLFHQLLGGVGYGDRYFPTYVAASTTWNDSCQCVPLNSKLSGTISVLRSLLARGCPVEKFSRLRPHHHACASSRSTIVHSSTLALHLTLLDLPLRLPLLLAVDLRSRETFSSEKLLLHLVTMKSNQ